MSWTALNSERGASIVQLMQMPNRAARFQVMADGMLFDYSKTSITEDARAGLLLLAQEHDVEARRAARFSALPPL